MGRAAVAAVGLVLWAASAGAQAPPYRAPDWVPGGTCYEVFVRSFQDSDGDGVGDLRGLIGRLDYINDGDPATLGDLGATCVWLMPFALSPTYHGYDVADYRRVDPRYGTNEDFRELVAQAHRRGIRVIVDMVLNHTSSEHPWFQSALRDPASPYRDWYLWRDAPGPDNEFGGNGWRPSPVRDEWFYGFFWHTMPDLNWETPAVRREMEDVARFWLLDMDVDGLRLDAVRHLMEDFATGRSANVARTHDMLREYGAFVRGVKPGAFTIGEVFDSTDVLAAYYPDQLDQYFAFQAANGILAAVRTGSADGLLRAVAELEATIPDHRYAPFLRNHDQRRTMTELEGDWARAKLAASLLFTLPGLPFVYYGEEIGMSGDKPDERIRTPMPWRVEPGMGFTTGTPWEPLQDDSLAANVAVQDGDPASLLNHYRRLVHLRAAEAALGAGDWVALDAGTDGVAAWLRRAGDAVALVVANLGEEAAPGVALASPAGALAPGRYEAEMLDAGGAPVPDAIPALAVGADGRMVGFAPLGELAPLTAYVLRLR